jgi:hypothetical protein
MKSWFAADDNGGGDVYRQLQRWAPHRPAFIHFLMAGLAASVLVG